MVGVEHDRVKLGEVLCGETVGLGLVVKLDGLSFDAFCKNGKVLVGIMVRACVSQKKDAERSGSAGEGK